MRFDEYDLEKTAEVLLTINNPLKYSKDELISFMRGIAYSHLHDDTKCRNMSTAGFHLSTYRDSDNEIVVRSTVTAYAVEKYLSSLKERLDILEDAAYTLHLM